MSLRTGVLDVEEEDRIDDVEDEDVHLRNRYITLAPITTAHPIFAVSDIPGACGLG